MIMPSHAKNVTNYKEQMPLFARHQIESYLSGMFNPTVQLPSGGYIVIDMTEALVAVDVNSGRATKEGSIEQTATKTNLEAAAEVARQLRLRDLAGLIVIDFIDMDERRNNAAVEKMMKDKLKTDRARIQVGRISGFGLMEMSRQRLRPGMLESTTKPCSHCHGTGLLRSDDTVALGILRQLEEEGVRGRSKEVLVKVPTIIANYLMNQKREHVAQIETRYGLSVCVEGDPHMVSPDFTVEKFKTASRIVAEVVAPAVISSDTAVMTDVEETFEEAEEQTTAPTPEAQDGDAPTKKRRRRRRRRRGGGGGENAEANGEGTTSSDDGQVAAQSDPQGDTQTDAQATAADETPVEATEDAPKPKRTRSRRKKSDDASAEATVEEAAVVTEDAPAEKPKRTRSRRKKADEPVVEAVEDAAPVAEEAPVEKPKRAPRSRKKPVVAEAAVAEPTVAPEAAPVEDAAPAEKPKRVRKTTSTAKAEPEAAPETKAAEPEAEKADDKPRKRGWWSMGGR